MKRIFLFFILALVGFSSCNKDSQNITLSGIFNEVSPVNGRSQLDFLGGNILIKSETGSSYRDTFIYKITKNKIELTSRSAINSGTYEFNFDLINNSKFQIQNLYPSIPEGSISYMTYEK